MAQNILNLIILLNFIFFNKIKCQKLNKHVTNDNKAICKFKISFF